MTTKTLTKPKTQLPTLNDDPYLKTAARVATAASFLKYVKGAFVFGIDEEEMALGTELVPNLTEAKIGWLKWHAGEVVEERMFPWRRAIRIGKTLAISIRNFGKPTMTAR